MKKLILVLLLLISSISFAQRIEFVDSNNVVRQVSYKYPLPIEIELIIDTLRIIEYKNNNITVPFPMKLYNSILEFSKLIIDKV